MLMPALFMGIPNPCAGAPTVTTCSVALTQDGNCSTTFAQWTVTVTLNGSLGSEWELEYYVCCTSSSGCTPTYRTTQTGLSYVWQHNDHEANAGVAATTFYANAKVRVVPVGESDNCDELAATQQSENPYRGCFG